MRTVVTVKVVPKSEEVSIYTVTMTLDREGARNELNRPDKNAIEMALQLTETHEGEVILLSMGPPLFEEHLRVGIGMGAHDAVLLSDRRFAGADTLPTSRALAEGIRRIGDVDLVLCGEESSDSATGQVPPGIAEWLGWPQLTYVTELRLLDDGRLAGKRDLSGGHEWIAVSLPAVVSVSLGCNSPRFPDFRRTRWAEKNLELKIWSADDLEVDPAELGIAGSPTIVDGVRQAPAPERRRERLEGPTRQVAARLAEHLRQFLRPEA